jgi:hypothetical protein
VQRRVEAPIGGILPAFNRVLALLVGVSGAIFPLMRLGTPLEENPCHAAFFSFAYVAVAARFALLHVLLEQTLIARFPSESEGGRYFVDVSGIKGPREKLCADSHASLLPMQLKGNEDLQQRVQIQNTTREQQKPYIDVSRPFLHTEPH